MKRIALPVVLLLVGAVAAHAQTTELKKAPKTEAKPVVVPFELFKTKHIAVQIKINGKGPYRVVFDTGAPMSLLSNKVARENKLIDKSAPQPLFNPFGAGGEAKIKKLEMGDLVVENTSAMVMDHPAIQAMSQAFGPVEGIVGFPVFARYKMTLDYEKKTMTFVPGDYDPPDVMKSLMKAMMSMTRSKEAQILSPGGQWGMAVEKDKDDKKEGVTVKEVLAGGAAAKAGLKAGDRLLTLDGRWTDSVAECYLAASMVKAGDEVVIKVSRDGKEQELRVKPTAGF
jgi:hypothetical protein